MHMTQPPSGQRDGDIFTRADWYDVSINWDARLAREIPVLESVLGPPGKGGLLDAGCGTARQACELARRGYRITGADASDEMIDIARRNATTSGVDAQFVVTPYDSLFATVGGGFDGLFCQGNALSAAGSAEAVRAAIDQFARCLRTGGRLFTQIVNFELMRGEQPCVRGPRIGVVDGIEYVSVRQFHFVGEQIQVTNITLFNDGGWKKRAHCGLLYPIAPGELREWCGAAGLAIDEIWGSYARDAFDAANSADVVLVATKR